GAPQPFSCGTRLGVHGRQRVYAHLRRSRGPGAAAATASLPELLCSRSGRVAGVTVRDTASGYAVIFVAQPSAFAGWLSFVPGSRSTRAVLWSARGAVAGPADACGARGA